MITARPETEGSITHFINHIPEKFHAKQSRKRDAVEALGTVVLRYKDEVERQLFILVVDESQGLQSNILEPLRGLFDREMARMGKILAPVSGLLSAGNSKFLARSGRP